MSAIPGFLREHTDTDCGPATPCGHVAILPKGWRQVNAVVYQHRSGLKVIRTSALERDGDYWLHVSISAGHGSRMPTYDEMVSVKEIFIGTAELALQVFPPRAEHVNDHPNVLHLWHCLDRRPTPDFRRGGTI